MADETIFCPECRSKVRVPESLLGQPVTCPLCRHTYTAPIRGGGSVAPAPAQPEPSPAAAVKPPAIALLVVGLLGLAVDLLGLGLTLALGPQGLAQQQQEQQQLMAAFGFPAQPVDPSLQFALSVLIYGILAICALGVVVGAWQMLRLRNYGLAVIGSILAAFNIAACCCVLGLPVGIWSLIVLLRPEVRSAFQ